MIFLGDMSTDTSSIAKKVAIGAIICCGSGAALYYLLKRLHTSSVSTSFKKCNCMCYI